MTLTIGKSYLLHWNINNENVTVSAKLLGDICTRQGQKFLCFERELATGVIKPYQFTWDAFMEMQGSVESTFGDGEEITREDLA